MVRIAICDDDMEWGGRAEQRIEEYFTKNGLAANIRYFSDGKSLLYEIEDRKFFDIFFLDIEMPKIGGIDLAEQINVRVPEALIIFLTSHTCYVYDSFKVRAFRFVPKDMLEQMLPMVLKDAVRQIELKDGRSYIAENQLGIQKLPYRHIQYIWHEGKYAVFQMEGGKEVRVRRTLKQIYDELDSREFVWIDRSYICNMEHIKSIDGVEVVMTDGTHFYLQRGRIKDFKDTLKTYWMEQEGIR